MAEKKKRETTPEEEVKTEVQADDEEISLADKMAIVDLPPVSGYLSTGCTLLDLAIANRLPGGFACGRISHVYGDESTGKSVLVQEPLGAAQRQNGRAFFVDAESTLDFSRAKELFGLKADPSEPNFIYEEPKSIEDLFDRILKDALEPDNTLTGPSAMAIDSLSAIPSEAELDTELVKGTYGTTRPKQLSTALRSYLRRIADSNLAMIFVDQTRTNIAATWGPKTTVSGGKALKFYASTRIELKLASKVKNKAEVVVGVDIEFTTTKNKIAPPYRRGKFRILFDYGIDDIASNIMFLIENKRSDVLSVAGSWLTYRSIKRQGMDALVLAIEEEGMEEPLQKDVEMVWHDMHSMPERKVKSRA